MTRLRLPAAQADEIKMRMKNEQGPILLEGPDGKPLAALVSTEQALADEAEKRFGVRPKKFYKGRPVWTEEDRRNPAFRWPYATESEWVAEVESAQEEEEASNPSTL